MGGRLMLELSELGTECYWPGEMMRVAINEAIGIDTIGLRVCPEVLLVAYCAQ